MHKIVCVDDESRMVVGQSEKGVEQQSLWNKHNFPLSKPQARMVLIGLREEQIIFSFVSPGQILFVSVAFVTKNRFEIKLMTSKF